MNVMTRRLPREGETTLMTTSIPKEPTQSTSAPALKKARAAKQRAHAAPPKAKSARKATGAKKPAPARRGSKTAKILDLLKRPGGATLNDLMKATGWQPHSVRGFLSGTIGKKMGTPVESTKRTDGERAYHVSTK
jgi:Protein of unknown function (DUF3489)